MPLNPNRVQAVFLDAPSFHDTADRAAMPGSRMNGRFRVAEVGRGAPERSRPIQ